MGYNSHRYPLIFLIWLIGLLMLNFIFESYIKIGKAKCVTFKENISLWSPLSSTFMGDVSMVPGVWNGGCTVLYI